MLCSIAIHDALFQGRGNSVRYVCLSTLIHINRTSNARGQNVNELIQSHDATQLSDTSEASSY